MNHPSDWPSERELGCVPCQEAFSAFHDLGRCMTEEKALAAYTFGRTCRAHDGGPCAWAGMLADDAYGWLYALVSLA